MAPGLNKRCSNLPDGESSRASGIGLSVEATVPSNLTPGKQQFASGVKRNTQEVAYWAGSTQGY